MKLEVEFQMEVDFAGGFITRADEAAVLRRAARLLQKSPWIQGSLGHLATGVCAVGAIRAAGSSYHGRPSAQIATLESWSATDVFGSWLRGIDPTLTVDPVPTWNDAPGRTKEEVIQHLLKCADELDPEHATP